MSVYLVKKKGWRYDFTHKGIRYTETWFQTKAKAKKAEAEKKKEITSPKPREVPMITKLYDILTYRFQQRDSQIPWVFWHSYWSRKSNKMVIGTYGDRKKIMKTLCKKAKVKYFRFHPFRHLTASILDDLGIAIGTILGHENRKTTEGYLHSVGDAERKAMKKLETVDLFSTPLPYASDRPTNIHPEYWIRKAQRPDYETLCTDIKKLGFVGTGKRYGVSDNAIRKWKKYYESQFENNKSLTRILTQNKKGISTIAVTP